MIIGKVTIINKLGLHARAAAKLVALSSKYSCNIHIGLESRMVDAKSIMAVMLLAAPQDTVLNLATDGEEAEAAFQELAQLINDRFGEDE
jgi:phosphocarrier protein HPr